MGRQKVPALPKATEAEQAALDFWKFHPVDAVKAWFDITPDDWQGDLLTALLGEQGSDRFAMKSAHGPGKGLYEHEKILTPNGWVAIGSLSVGDMVASADGTFSRVLGVYHRGILSMWRVTFSDGSYLTVDGEHLWWTDTRTQRTHKTKDQNHIRSTLDIKDSLFFKNGQRRGLNHRIPTAQPIQHPERALPIDPFLLGFWLGDGHHDGRLDYDGIPPEKTVLLRGVRRIPLPTALRGKHSWERFIPQEYLFASIKQRIALLHGLLDTDGECSKGNEIIYSTTSPQLRDDVAELARSLGGMARISAARITHYPHHGEIRDGRPSWRVSISMPQEFIPFRHATKAVRYHPSQHPNKTRELSRFIVSIEPDKPGEVVCIRVEHPSALFVTKDHIVTHNTAVEAWAGWVFLKTRRDSRVVASAPTKSQLSDILWPEYAKWHARMTETMQNEWLISGTHIRHKERQKLWFALARTSNKSANLQGFHNTDLFIEIDEASGVPQEVFEVIEGALSEAGEKGKTAKLLIGGNPNFTTGELHDAFTKNKALYNRLTITGDPLLLPALGLAQGAEHPLHGRAYYSQRVKPKYVQTIYAKYGEESAVADVRVRGVFPRHDDNAVIPFEWAERARGALLPKFDIVAHPVTLVLDPARYGGNESVIGAFRRGIPVQPLKGKPMTSLKARGDMVEEECLLWQKRKIAIERVIVDEPGIGGDTIEEIERRGISCTPYHGGQPLRADVDPADEVRMFHNRRARDYWLVRRALELRTLPLPDDEVLVSQLSSLRYSYMKNTQKILIESKKDLTDRLGHEASPDRADVIVMGTSPWRSLGVENAGFSEQDIFTGDDRPADTLVEAVGSYRSGVL